MLGRQSQAASVGDFDKDTYGGEAIHFIDPCNKQSIRSNFINHFAKYKVRSVLIAYLFTETTMTTSRKFSRLILPALMTLGIVASTGAGAEPAAALSIKTYNADGNSFHVNAVVVSGKREAVVIDTGFTRADALRVAANVLDSGKTLMAILKMAEHICSTYRVLGNQTVDHEWNAVGDLVLDYVGLSDYDFDSLKLSIRELGAH